MSSRAETLGERAAALARTKIDRRGTWGKRPAKSNGGKRAAAQASPSKQGHQIVAVAFEFTGEIEFQKHQLDLACLDSGQPDQIIDRCRCLAQQGSDAIVVGAAELHF